VNDTDTLPPVLETIELGEQAASAARFVGSG
jgi:hypothetical protein